MIFTTKVIQAPRMSTMKKMLSLLLLVPLASIAAEHAGKAAEHGGKAMQKRAVVEQATEQGEKEIEETDHTETAAEQGEMSIEAMKKEHAGKAAEHAGTPVK